MKPTIQAGLFDTWGRRQVDAFHHFPVEQKVVQAGMPNQIEILRQVVALGWEVFPPSGPVSYFRAFKPDMNAPKRVEVWKDTPQELLAACTERNTEAPKCHAQACCEQAKAINCVCEFAWKCPEHGERHFGTHD